MAGIQRGSKALVGGCLHRKPSGTGTAYQADGRRRRGGEGRGRGGEGEGRGRGGEGGGDQARKKHNTLLEVKMVVHCTLLGTA